MRSQRWPESKYVESYPVKKRLVSGAVAALLVLILGVHSALAYVICRSDPLLTLYNSRTVSLNSYAYNSADANAATSITYTVYMNATDAANTTVDTGGDSIEHVTLVGQPDRHPNTMAITMVLSTNNGSSNPDQLAVTYGSTTKYATGVTNGDDAYTTINLF